eukprot:GHUV01015987.1.p1 GENE.GHUV01015987.1~~GHUV01015987.1.p1  ORF type:complete len:577 (+),score=197.40 GHUV01015987.1:393-2123(+)
MLLAGNPVISALLSICYAVPVVADPAYHYCRKRKLSGAFTDPDFARFLVETFGSFDSGDVDPSLLGLLARPGSVISHESILNDLPGAMSHEDISEAQQATAAPSQHTQPASNPQQQSVQTTASLSPAPSQPQQLLHRAVITALPVPAQAGGAAAAPVDEDDTNSAATLPMPNKRRCTDDEEVTSTPNDLVEVPSSTVVTTASGTAQRAAATSDTAAGGRSDQQQKQSPAAVATANAAAAADGDVVKAILVAKVLTKSDSNSKRVILPRIAVEANLPQLAHAQCFNFSATDPHEQSWPLVIKAWANGQNPKPVYVLEQVGELLKQYKITVGDALALMASEDGKFFLEWNTEAARAAAARPTYSAFTFKQQQKAAPATSAPASAPGTPKAQNPQPVAASSSDQQQPADTQQQLVAVKQQTDDVQQQAADAQQQPMHAPQPQQSAFQRAQQQQQLPPRPLMTAIPVNSTPMVSGTFIPTSPCQLLVMGDAGTAPYLRSDDPMVPSLPASVLMLHTRSDAAEKLPEPENLLLPLPAELGDNGALHMGGFLVCPRTPGCTRPAGHQGWCLGHKGYKKRGRV